MNAQNSRDQNRPGTSSRWKARRPQASSTQLPQTPLQAQSESAEDEKRRRRAARFQQTSGQTRQGYGFVSRGEDNRLQKSSRDREQFFDEIVTDFVCHCEHSSTAALREELRVITCTKEDQKAAPNTSSGTKRTVSIDSILSSLRKLREALLSLKPDAFSVKVFLFSVRIAASMGHYQTYVPSINYLLKGEAAKLLSPKEHSELATLLVLHLAHFNNHHTKALETYHHFFGTSRENPTLVSSITSWYKQDYCTWVRIYNAETDNARARLMAFGVTKIVQTMVRIISASYFTMESAYLHQLLPNGVDFATLKEKYGVSWREDGSQIVIRERRRQ